MVIVVVPRTIFMSLWSGLVDLDVNLFSGFTKYTDYFELFVTRPTIHLSLYTVYSNSRFSSVIYVPRDSSSTLSPLLTYISLRPPRPIHSSSVFRLNLNTPSPKGPSLMSNPFPYLPSFTHTIHPHFPGDRRFTLQTVCVLPLSFSCVGRNEGF